MIAAEQGAGSWVELCRRLAPVTPSAATPEYYAPPLAFYLNRWFADHAEARASLLRDGG